MFAKVKTGTKVVAGFGIAIVFTAVVGISGWNRLARVTSLVTVGEDAGSAVCDLLDARCEEKHFELRGFERYGSDTVQQAASAQEVSKAIQGVSSITEQAAAGSEQMASSSQELGAQAASLRDLIGQFHVGSDAANRENAAVA